MLEGKLVTLRAIEPDDLERNYQWVNDREVTRNLVLRYPLSRADERNFTDGRSANSYANTTLAIETRQSASGGKDGVHIGNCGLHEVQPENRKASLGIMIGDKRYWSNGYGTDAVVTLLRFAFNDMNLNRVWLHVYEFNERAIACYRKCGFVEEGRLRQNYYGEGRYWDTITMGVLRPEFEAVHGGPAG